MSSNWETLKVQDILYTTDYVANGSFASIKENVKYLNKQDYAVLIRLVDFNSGWNGDFVYVDKKSYDFLKKSYVEPKDVIISNVGANVGTVFQAPNLNQPMTLGPNSVLVKPAGDNIDRDFVYYFFTSPIGQSKLSSIVSGSAQPKFNKTDLRNIDFPLPPLPIQKKIAHILSTLDDKIELNRKMNQTLEEMASAIFKSWFVDFDPVHAKANCEDEAELENIAKELGISKAILDLFPSEFEESELGMIPKGWEATELSQICKIQSGYAFKSAWWQDTGVKVIKIKNIDGNRVNTLDCECVSEEIATKNSNFKLLNGDMLIAMTGATVGKVGVIYTSDEEYLLNQRVGRFQPIKYYDEYVKIFASSSKFFESIQGQAQGSAQPNISAREIETVKIIKPNNEIMKVFSSLLNPFFSKILEHQGEIQTLEKTRDTLLPKLLSGEIDVSELKI